MENTQNSSVHLPGGSTPLFITGTDTNAGKTFVTCLVLRFLSGLGRTPRVLKPVCCGGRGDLDQLLAAAPEQAGGEINRYYFDASATPSVAAALEGKSVDRGALVEWCRARAGGKSRDPVLLEGAGGWMVPIDGSWCVADWAQELHWPLLLIVAERLGCLNHTLLTVRDIQRRSLPLAGIILNRVPEGEEAAGDHREVLEKDFAMPVWGRVDQGAKILPEEIGHKLLEWI